MFLVFLNNQIAARGGNNLSFEKKKLKDNFFFSKYA